MRARRPIRIIAIGATALAIGGGAYGIVGATADSAPGTATTAMSPSTSSGRPVPGGGGSNARSGPAAGGSIARVSGVSASGFGLLTPAGQKVTVKETSTTTYEKGTKPAAASAVAKGESALVLGRVDGATITATQVTCDRHPARPRRRT